METMNDQVFDSVKDAVSHARSMLKADLANYCDFNSGGVRIIVAYNWDATRIDVSITTPRFDRISQKSFSGRLTQAKAQEIIGDSKVKMVDFGY